MPQVCQFKRNMPQ